MDETRLTKAAIVDYHSQCWCSWQKMEYGDGLMAGAGLKMCINFVSVNVNTIHEIIIQEDVQINLTFLGQFCL